MKRHDTQAATTSAEPLKLDEEIISTSAEETLSLGEQLAATLTPGSVVALFGDLGSGKTTFIKGVCAGLQVEDEATSPTFTLIHEYQGQLPVYHFDFYRIQTASEILELGCDEYFYGRGICLIEWADRAVEFLPAKRFEVWLQHETHKGAESCRIIRFKVK
ncbi:MAG: tRNA (adenosine(37)-N6)-threonylcarbamoyltransferase complex ATPase subunit type 1 TsaE [bacterium]